MITVSSAFHGASDKNSEENDLRESKNWCFMRKLSAGSVVYIN